MHTYIHTYINDAQWSSTSKYPVPTFKKFQQTTVSFPCAVMPAVARVLPCKYCTHSIISLPYHLHKVATEVYLLPPLAIHGKFNKNGRTRGLRQTRGRLDSPYPLNRVLLHWPSDWLHSGRLVASWWWCKNCIALSDRTHSAPSLIISCYFALKNWATISYFTSCMRRWRTILPLLFPSCAPKRGKTAYKWDNYQFSIVSPTILVAKSNQQKEGRIIEWVW